jgi:hypothetical protein
MSDPSTSLSTSPRGGWLWKMLLEVMLIGVAVFLGMAADQWRTDRQHREQARAALVRLKTEIESNKAAVAATIDYHVRIRKEVTTYLDTDAAVRKRATLNINRGIWPVNFEHAAWDLALATQALADVDSALAFEIARVYGAQDVYVGLTTGLGQAMYLRPPSENFDGFLHSVRIWLDDIVTVDPGLMAAYDRVLPLIDAALKD